MLPDKDKVEEMPEAKKENKVELVFSEDTDPFLFNLEMEEDPGEVPGSRCSASWLFKSQQLSEH